MPGESLLLCIMDDHIPIIGRQRNANSRVRVEPADSLEVINVDPASEQSSYGVIERRLAAFLLPERIQARSLDGKCSSSSEVSYEGIMMQLITSLEHRHGHAVQQTQADERSGDNSCSPVIVESTDQASRISFGSQLGPRSCSRTRRGYGVGARPASIIV